MRTDLTRIAASKYRLRVGGSHAFFIQLTSRLLRTRHLKCDEERPTCLRCRKDKFTCDGYLPQVKTVSCSIKPKKPQCTSLIPKHIDCGISGSILEKYFFNHVSEFTIKDLAFSAPGSKFWQRLVLPAAHSDESVKHALVALGTAHRLFMSRTADPQLEALILQQYNLAIRHLASRLDGAVSNDLQLTLICCLVFFCLESVRGNYIESMQHLRAGSRLLSTHLASTSGESMRQNDRNLDELLQIADIFSTLGVDASFFMEEHVVSPLHLDSSLAAMEVDTSKPFKDLGEARKDLSIITVNFLAGVERNPDNWYSPEMLTLYDKCRRWATKLDNTVFHFPNGSPSVAEQRELMALKLHRSVWIAVIDCGPSYPTAPISYERTFSQALDLAEELIQSGNNDDYPLFTLQGDVVSLISHVCDIAPTEEIQHRAINLLRSAKRREGMWDSQEVAEYLEDYILAKKMLQLNWENVPGGLPGSVRMLQGLNLSTLSPRNGILRVAYQGKLPPTNQSGSFAWKKKFDESEGTPLPQDFKEQLSEVAYIAHPFKRSSIPPKETMDRLMKDMIIKTD